MLELRNLTVYRGEKKICENLSILVERGSTLIIRGRNGSGKSTLLEFLMGVSTPASGQVILDDRNLHDLSRAERKLFLGSTGIVLQQSLLRNYDTPRRALSEQHLSEEKISEMLDFLGLEQSADRPLNHLSFGEKRRLDLVRSLVNDPSLLIWDEPFLSLDGVYREKFQSILLKLKSMGSTMIIATVSSEQFEFLSPEKVLEL